MEQGTDRVRIDDTSVVIQALYWTIRVKRKLSLEVKLKIIPINLSYEHHLWS